MNREKAVGGDSEQITLLRAIFSGWVLFVWSILISTLIVEILPHTRGLGFPLPLRLACIGPVSFVSSFGAAFLYWKLSTRYERPHLIFACLISGIAFAFCFCWYFGIETGSFIYILSISFVQTGFFSWVVPKLIKKKLNSKIGIFALSIFGTLELAGVFFAVRSEYLVSFDPVKPDFEISRSIFDVDHKYAILPSGAKIHYIDEGKGEVLLFLHGNPSWSFQWRDLIHGLRGSYRCIALDYPGFGFSEAPPGYGFTPREQSIVLQEFVDQLKLKKVTLIMQDWGGPIGLGLAGRRPQLVDRMILGSTWAWKTKESTPRGIFSKIMGGPIGEFIQMNFNGFTNFGIRNGIVRKLSPEVLEIYTRPFLSLQRRGVAAFYPGQITNATDYFTEVENGLTKLSDKKVLIFWALRDQGFPEEDLAKFQKAFPNHKTIKLPEADHFFFEDTLEIMLPEILEFLPRPMR